MSDFVIFAHPRSGSTSLARVLAESPDVKMAIEPFHPKYSTWNSGARNYSEFIKDEKTMNQALDELFAKYTAIKVLDYQFPEKIYFSMLKRNDLKVLFLRRKDLLAAALSNAIGEQTGQWHKQADVSIYDNLKPIDITKIRKWMKYVSALNDEYYQYLQKHRKRGFMPLYYENLFSTDFNENKKNLEKICLFLEITLPPDSAIEEFMSPSRAKINFQNIYSKIPNYREVVNEFGGLIGTRNQRPGE